MSHSHNLIIDTAFNFGLIVAITIFTNIFLISFLSFKKINFSSNKEFSDNLFEKAWWTSIFTFCFTQILDIQYFDGRISIISWILLCGLKQMLDENNSKKDILYNKLIR